MYSSNKTLVGDVATILFIFHKFYMNIINQKGQTLNTLTII